MRRSFVLGAFALVALTGITCSFPDDQSADIYVTIETPAVVLVNGDLMSVRARAWQLVGGVPDTGNTDDVELVNVEFLWTTGDDLIAEVQNDGAGYATITALDPGLVDIDARLIAFEQASNATLPLRVANFIEIDSVTPTVVKWGDKVTLWGVGVQFATFPRLAGVRLLPDTLTFTQTLGMSRMEFWVPQPAASGLVTVTGPGFFFTVLDPVFVDTLDLYEFNDTIGTPFNLDATPPYPQVPTLLFNNPALAFEAFDQSILSYRQDYYRYTKADSTQPLTFIIKPDRVTDTSQLFFYFTDSLDQFGGDWFFPPPGAQTWLIGQGFGFQACNDDIFFGDQVAAESTVIAFRTLPTKKIQDVNFYVNPGNYEMRVVAAYLTADPRIGPDRFEENDLWCKWADANYARGDSIVISRTRPPFTASLTIDNPHDMDWFRFRVATGLTDTVVIRTAPRPFPGEVDRSDIDLYVYSASPSAFNFQGSISSTSSFEDLIIELAPGDYYLGVMDYPGAATRYGICMTVGFNQACLPPGVTAGSSAAALRFGPTARPQRPRRTSPLDPANLLRGRAPFRRP